MKRISDLPIPDGVYEVSASGNTHYFRVVNGAILGVNGATLRSDQFIIGKRIGDIP